MINNFSAFSFPTQILFGAGSIRQLPDCLDETSVSRPLLVTDPGLAKTEAFSRVKEVLDDAKREYSIFSKVHPNPIDEDVTQAAAQLATEECDGVVGVGGGSALDVAKALTVIAAHQERVENYEAQFGGFERITGPLVPIIAVPTTAGTGSEVGRSAVISVPKLGRKVVVFSPLILPSWAIADPELTIGLPPSLTAATGMDAFTHNLESYTSTEFHPICDAIALGGLELVLKFLERATTDGNDIEARGYMMIAAMMGAIAFQKELGATHSLAHPLSTECGIHHGLANAVCLPAVMRFNAESEKAAKGYAKLATLFDLDTQGIDDRNSALLAADAVAELNSRIGIPSRLRDCGVPDEILPTLARKAFEDSCHQTNPRPCSEQDLLALYEAGW